jgi:cell division septation protein DedD
MAENRREKDRRFYFTKGQMVLLGGAFTVASIIIFVLGMFIGKEIEARKLVKPEEPLVKVPVKPAPKADSEAEGGKNKDDLTFYNTLTKAPAAKPAVEAKAEETEPKKTTGAATKGKTLQSQDAATARSKAADKGGENAPTGTEAETEAVKTAEGKTTSKNWSVQVNAYPDEKSANDLVDRLKNKGYNAFVTQANIKGKVWYRVRVGRFGSREEAEKTEESLKNKENLGKAFATIK